MERKKDFISMEAKKKRKREEGRARNEGWKIRKVGQWGRNIEEKGRIGRKWRNGKERKRRTNEKRERKKKKNKRKKGKKEKRSKE